MSDRRWKRLERELAARVGGRRIPVTGERDGVDVQAGPFAYQLKSRGALPQWLWTWLCGITGKARETGQTGVLVLHRPGQEMDDAVVVLRLRDWEQWHGALPTGEGRDEG